MIIFTIRVLYLDTDVENYRPIREIDNDSNKLQLISKSSYAPQLDASINTLIPGLHDFLLIEVECVQMNAVSADKGCVALALVRTELTARSVWERKQIQKYYLSLALDQVYFFVYLFIYLDFCLFSSNGYRCRSCCYLA